MSNKKNRYLYLGSLVSQNKIYLSTSYYLNDVVDNIKVIDRPMIETYKKIYEQHKDNKLQDNSTVHFSPLTNLPQFKFKNYVTDNKLNISKVRSGKSFDSLILSDTYIRDYYLSQEKYIKKHYIIPQEILNSYLSNNNSWISDKKTEFFIADQDSINKVQSIKPTLYKRLIECEFFEGAIVRNGWGNGKSFDNFDSFKNLIDNYNSIEYNIIFDETINNEINKGLIVDEDIATSLLTMLSSTDQSNHSLAKEMIANCELESSKPYILFLMWRFPYLRKANGNKNYEFCLKSLSKYTPICNAHGIENFIASILGINPEFKQTLFNCFKLYVNHQTGKSVIKEINVL